MASAVGNRILVYRIGSLGDTLIALPAFHALKRNFPNAYFALLESAPDEPGRVTARSVLPPKELFDAWLTYRTGLRGTAFVTGQWQLLRELRRQSFDTLVYLAPRLRNVRQVKRDLFFFRLAGIRSFVGHRGLPSPLPRKEEGSPLPALDHEADHLLHRLSLSGLSIPAPGAGSMDLLLDETERAQARRWLLEHCGAGFLEDRLVAVTPASNWPSKVWPEANFASIGEKLMRESGLFPVIFGGGEDKAVGERLIASWKGGANAAGAFSVRESAAALSYCRLLVGNDTGTIHLAAAVGTPCVVVFAAQDWPGRWDPYGQARRIVLREAVPCEGCMLRVCDKENLCLTSISVERVSEACVKILGLPDPHRQRRGPARRSTAVDPRPRNAATEKT